MSGSLLLLGGVGQSSNDNDGSITEGAHPDGGGTRTGHCSNTPQSPATGGGSTSIRIENDSLYSRVIVAGGAGGAGGTCGSHCHGGFGGGKSGGNSYVANSLRSEG